MKTITYREEVFIIEWTSLPQEQKDYVYEKLDYQFHNDSFINLPTEFDPWNDQSFSDSLTMANIVSYWKDQCETNDFKEDLEYFIKDYGLEFDVWIIKQNFDLTGIKKILIDISY